MILYADTSALAKKYNKEIGSEDVRRLIDESVSILTSTLTELELTSAIERAKREGRIDSPSYRAIYASIEHDVRSGAVSLVSIQGEIIQDAKRLIRQRRLRVQDSIQLASALAARRSADSEIIFLCADRALLEAARLEGLKCPDISA